MDIEKLIRRLRNDADAYRNGETLGRAFADQEDVLDNAATALSTLQAENKRLNKIVCSIPTTPDSGRTVSQYDKEMSMCAYLDDLEAENEKLRADLEYEREHANAYHEECSRWEAENEKLRAELEQIPSCIYYKQGGLCRYGGDDPANVCVLGPCPHERTAEEVLADLARMTAERDAAVNWAQKYTESIDRPCVACKHNTGDYVCTAICGNCGPMGTESCKWEFDFSGELKED